ncbi:MAG: hypothetical protein C4B59_17840, partial [Candidatus Methanogaster sp.]
VVGQHLNNSINMTWTSINETMGNESYERSENRTDKAPVQVNNTANISKTPDYPRNAAIGESVNFTIFVDLPNATLYNVTVNDMLPAGFIYNSPSFNLTANNDSFNGTVSDPNNGSAPVHVNWTLGTVNNSNNRDITINFNATIANVLNNQNGTVLNNSAIFNWVDYNNVTGNDSDESGNITILGNEADLSITLSDSHDPVTAGRYLWYEINVTNNGPDYAYNVSVVDALPSAVAFSSASPVPNESTGMVHRWNFTGIEASSSVPIEVCVATGATGVLKNTVNVNSATYDPDETNNVDTEYTTVQGSGGHTPEPTPEPTAPEPTPEPTTPEPTHDGPDPTDGDGTKRHPSGSTGDSHSPGPGDRRIPDEMAIPFIAFLFLAIPLILFRVDVVDNGELSP